MSALLESFAAAFEALPLRDDAELHAARASALAAALRDGLPGTRSERWKYTPLRAFERRTFAPAFLRDASMHAPAVAQLVAGIAAPRIVFVNGHYDPTSSDVAALADGASLQPLSRLLADGASGSSDLMATEYARQDEVFARVNGALATDGVVLRISDGTRIEAPINLVFAGAPVQDDVAAHLRHVIEVGEGADVSVVEHHVAVGPHANLFNDVSQVRLHAGARLTHIRLQDEALAASLVRRTDAALDTGATYRRLDLELGAGLSRHELNAELRGEGARVLANGVLLADGKRHLDTRLGIDHAAPDTHCDLLWRGLGAGRSRAAFHGGILIREGADGSIASLSNKNLLLSVGAEIDTQPVLEIHADEVQAAHGAAVGQIDATSMFYLRSRGIPEMQARALLTAAFCREALGVVEDQAIVAALLAALDATLARLETA